MFVPFWSATIWWRADGRAGQGRTGKVYGPIVVVRIPTSLLCCCCWLEQNTTGEVLQSGWDGRFAKKYYKKKRNPPLSWVISCTDIGPKKPSRDSVAFFFFASLEGIEVILIIVIENTAKECIPSHVYEIALYKFIEHTHYVDVCHSPQPTHCKSTNTHPPTHIQWWARAEAKEGWEEGIHPVIIVYQEQPPRP